MGGSLTYRYDDRSIFRLELPRNDQEERRRGVAVGPSVDVSGRNQGAVGIGRIGVDVGVID